MQHGGRLLPLLCDQTKPAEVAAAYVQAERELGPSGVSVQNAGVNTIAKVENLTEREWELNLDPNAERAFPCQGAIRRVRASGTRGRILSTAWCQPRDGVIFTPYCAASKFGVVGPLQSQAREVAAEGTTVSAICPDPINTDIWDDDRVRGQMRGDRGAGELTADWPVGIPMKRAGVPAEVGARVVVLASEVTAGIIGQTISVDGGLVMS
ncbi:3-oxoacyl-[acyl-carrier protein] reductase [Rubellimicrobium mesophilum DSM 19309]|uniref:3-oxoacyl-[acyl-carrier protein] reductase n=1 Tax=Rubellimicrobium mesophilum DSM 19309 TaxID=442562 RepID=A0A017HME0_9RHOB|nr:SDR family oxidoreductase [Rubellimicrobium mesophilum]EYD74944.1 3-oxoacyl-[acyl-carrier protein] reductase [Rubellimicrobium mesophilum DSM 19309]